MGKRTILIDTWNASPGYSESGIIDFPENWDEGCTSGAFEFAERYLSLLETYDDVEIEIKMKNTFNYRYWSFSDGEDAGCIHLIEGEFYGVLIWPDTNEIIPLNTKEGFDYEFSRIVNSAIEEEEGLINEMKATGNVAAHTSEGYEIIYNLT